MHLRFQHSKCVAFTSTILTGKKNSVQNTYNEKWTTTNNENKKNTLKEKKKKKKC